MMTDAPLTVTISSRYIKKSGLEKWTYRIAEEFSKKKVFVNILTSDPVIKDSPNPLIQVHTLPLKKWLNFQRMDEFDHLVQQWNINHQSAIVFGMDRTRDQTHMRAGNGVHMAYLQQRHAVEGYSYCKRFLNPLNQKILNIEKEAFESPRLKILFTNSHMVKNEILAHYKVCPNKIEVIHNGVPWKSMEKDFHSWVEKKREISIHCHLDPTLYHFLFIGNGYRRKGLTPLLKALSTFKGKPFHLSVIGKDRKMKTFIKQAKALGLENHVSFFGPSPTILPFLQIGDCLVIPSYYDPFANVTVEALAMGLFVVSSKTNGGHEILTKETGTTIENLSSLDSLKGSLEIAMNHPKTWRRSNTIRSSVKHLDLPQQLSSYIELSLQKQ